MSNDDKQLEDLESFLSDDAFVTPPIKGTKFPEGKVYSIPSPDGLTGLRLNGLANLAAKAATGVEIKKEEVEKLSLDDDEERSFMQQVLGPVYQELLDDGVSWVKIQRLNQYAFAYFAVSPQAAVKGVESGAFLGKATAPNRAARRAKKSSTGAKSGRPASGAGKSPKKQTA